VSHLRISDDIEDHPQFVPLSHRAFRVWVYAEAWSQRHLTDGRVPALIMRSLRHASPTIIRELVAIGLAIPQGDDYLLAGWLKHNDSRAVVEKRRAQKAKRIAAWRARQHPPVDGLRDALRDGLQDATVTVALTSPHLTSVDPKNGSTRHARATRKFVFRGQRFEITQLQWDALTRSQRVEFLEGTDWFAVWSQWDREAADERIDNLLPWLRARVKALADAWDASVADEHRASDRERRIALMAECERIHGGRCGHPEAHALAMRRTTGAA
jgi:hypothetical protein